MKKVILSKTSTLCTNKMDENCGSVYQLRKKMEPHYKELFKVLLTLPDKEVVKRVISAINGENDSPKTHCQCTCITKKTTSRDVFTQTEMIGVFNECVEDKTSPKPSSSIHRPSSEDSLKSDADAREEDDATMTTTTSQPEATATTTTVPKRKRRKRKICMPHVSHVSQAQVLCKLQPKMAKRSDNDTVSNSNTRDNSKDGINRSRTNSFGSLSDFPDLEDLCHQLLHPPTSPALDDIRVMMANEFYEAEQIIDGLLPIHTAISTNDIKKLKRQLFVWKHKDVDVNELLTDDNQDCLQLAIIHNILPEIVQILLEAKLNVNCVDDHSNTIVHLAIFNEIDLASLELLLERIDLSTLLKLNDKGHSPLHMAVRHDRYLHAEVLLNAVDKRTLGKIVYKRQTESFINLERRDDQQKAFLKYYENACDSLETLESNFSDTLTKAHQKRKLVELGELCSGNTALFHALEDRMEHFIYFLLAHLSDPRCPNHSGQDAKSYFAEFSKSLSLSLKIDRTMEKVIAFIEKSSK